MKLQENTTLKQAAAILSCEYIGNPNHIISGFNEIHLVEKGDATFTDVAKYYEKALTSAATTIIINQQVEAPEGKALLIHHEPFTAYNTLTEHFQPRSAFDTFGEPILGKNVKIGRNVVFGKDVVLGDNVEIGHNTTIGSNVRIGNNSLIYANVFIADETVIGNDVCINAGCVIGGEGFYFKSRANSKEKLLSKGRVVIHDHVDIGANCTIDKGISGDTTIGEWTKLDSLIQIGHDTVIGKRCLIAAQVGIAGVVVVEDDVMIWGQAGINKDLTIGKGATILGKTGVMSSLAGGKKYLGMIANDHREALRQEASMRQLPDFMAKVKKALGL